ncbi:MAG: DUF5615 family PIN-like protein [Bacteroidetes bacterium]|nr:DUF5615 family PIN-like protein [Bacteroidota bacterium]
MKFLLDMNIPRALGVRLASRGHECRHVADIGMDRASDLAIVEEARAKREIIVTHDLDFGQLLAFSGERGPSVVIFRVRDTHPDNLFARIWDVWPLIDNPLETGAVV